MSCYATPIPLEIRTHILLNRLAYEFLKTILYSSSSAFRLALVRMRGTIDKTDLAGGRISLP
ncbi:hypothetical protein H2248_004117 [Termitomyces sp. 'cryptogamus']|nr:hypothetical protein H2248_004117 [Termitomyces sp. 'cryptogamus']